MLVDGHEDLGAAISASDCGEAVETFKEVTKEITEGGEDKLEERTVESQSLEPNDSKQSLLSIDKDNGDIAMDIMSLNSPESKGELHADTDAPEVVVTQPSLEDDVFIGKVDKKLVKQAKVSASKVKMLAKQNEIDLDDNLREFQVDESEQPLSQIEDIGSVRYQSDDRKDADISFDDGIVVDTEHDESKEKIQFPREISNRDTVFSYNEMELERERGNRDSVLSSSSLTSQHSDTVIGIGKNRASTASVDSGVGDIGRNRESTANMDSGISDASYRRLSSEGRRLSQNWRNPKPHYHSQDSMTETSETSQTADACQRRGLRKRKSSGFSDTSSCTNFRTSFGSQDSVTCEVEQLGLDESEGRLIM